MKLTNVFRLFPFPFLTRPRICNSLLLFALSSVIISGCLGGGGSDGGSSSSSSGSSSGGAIQGIKIQGIGLDGPLSYGMIDFFNSDGSHCEATATDENSFYEVIIPTSCTFPLKVVMTEGIDASTNLTNPTTLYSLVLDQNISTININTYTTLIYYAALARTTDGSLRSIREQGIDIDTITYQITTKFNFGIDAEDPQFNPLKTPVTSRNIASLVKANEGLMEGIRRTAKAASEGGETNAATIGQVISALGTDISDGLLNGTISNFNDQGYEVFQLSGPQLIGIWETNALDVAMELMTNQLAISLTEEQKSYTAETSRIPRGNVPATLGPARVAQNLATAIQDMIYNLGGFITQQEALQRLEQIGITAKLLNQTQSALKFQMSLAVAKGLNLAPLNSIKAILDNLSQRMSAIDEVRLSLDQMRAYLGATHTSAVSASVKDGTVDNKAIAAAISNGRFELNSSTPLTQNRRKLSATWEYAGADPEKFRLYETHRDKTKLTCEIPGNSRSSELVECYTNIDETPKEFYLTAYASGSESGPSPKIAYTNTMPAAIFHASFIAGQVPLTVDFNAANSYDPDGKLTRFMWDFGDGTQYAGLSVSHTFQTPGTYNILLKVWDDYADQKSSPGSALATLRITVGEELNTLAEPPSFIGSVRTMENDPFASTHPTESLSKSSAIALSSKSSKNNDVRVYPFPAAQNEMEKVDLRAEDPLVIKQSESQAGPTGTIPSVHTFLTEWLKAWERSAGAKGDIISYGAMYSDKFKSQNLGKKSWVKDKTIKNSRKEWIRLNLTDIEIKEEAEGKILVLFQQHYNSSNFSDSSKKLLSLSKTKNNWEIVKEDTLD